MDLKYKQYIDLYDECESKECIARRRVAFRWTFESIKDKRNFLPRYLLPAYENEPKESCVGYSLSMFDKADQAIDRLKKLSKGKNNIYKKLGTHLASGTIEETDGISGLSSINQINKGHFSIFEYVNADFSETFKIQEKLIKD